MNEKTYTIILKEKNGYLDVKGDEIEFDGALLVVSLRKERVAEFRDVEVQGWYEKREYL